MNWLQNLGGVVDASKENVGPEKNYATHFLHVIYMEKMSCKSESYIITYKQGSPIRYSLTLWFPATIAIVK